MQRRLIKQGAATLTVSLPADWTKKHRLKAGDIVDVSEREGALIVGSHHAAAPRTCQINVAGLSDRIIYRMINATYIRGADEVEVLFDKPEHLDVIQRVADSLMGFTIIKQGKQSCVIKDISGLKQEEFENILRRMFLLILSISEDTLDALRKKDATLLKGIPHRDWSVNKLAYACLRVLNKHGHQRYHDTTSIFNMVWTLEEISDEYQSLAQEAADAPAMTLSPKAIKQLEGLNDVLRKVYELYYKYDKNGLVAIYHTKEEIKQAVSKIVPANALEVRAITIFERLFELLTDVVQQIMAVQL